MTEKGEKEHQRKPEPENLTATQEKYLLALYRLQITGVTQMEVAKELGVTSVSTSKTIRELITKGFVNRDNHFCISLSSEGMALADALDDRYTTIVRYLADGLDMEEEQAAKEALELALHMSPEFSAALLRKIEEDAVQQYPLHYQDICPIADVLKDGVYELPFQLLRLKEDRVSMGNKGFLHPCTLEVQNGTAKLQLCLSEMSCRHKSIAGRTITGKLMQLRYYTENGYREAQITEDTCSITLDRMELQLDTHGNPRSGCLPVRVAASVGVNVMPESNARLVFNFRVMKKSTKGTD